MIKGQIPVKLGLSRESRLAKGIEASRRTFSLFHINRLCNIDPALKFPRRVPSLSFLQSLIDLLQDYEPFS